MMHRANWAVDGERQLIVGIVQGKLVEGNTFTQMHENALKVVQSLDDSASISWTLKTLEEINVI